MSDAIGDLLPKRIDNEPPDFAVIRTFISKHFNLVPKLAVHPSSITITVPSAAIAGELRFKLHELQSLCSSDKRLIIRIGS